MHARGSGETARRAPRATSHARGHLRVSRFARRTTEKRETARSLRVFALADLFGSWMIGNLERSLRKHGSVTFAFMH